MITWEQLANIKVGDEVFVTGLTFSADPFQNGRVTKLTPSYIRVMAAGMDFYFNRATGHVMNEFSAATDVVLDVTMPRFEMPTEESDDGEE
jgi:hypothetical protein